MEIQWKCREDKEFIEVNFLRANAHDESDKCARK